jgi:hypothetical protein
LKSASSFKKLEICKFFREWQDELPDLSSAQQQWLDSVRENFLSLAKENLHEEIVKLVVLSPLLSLAGLTRYPFVPQAEGQVEICFKDTDDSRQNQCVGGASTIVGWGR